MTEVPSSIPDSVRVRLGRLSISRTAMLLLAVLPPPVILFHAAWHANLEARQWDYFSVHPHEVWCTTGSLAIATEGQLVSMLLLPFAMLAVFWMRRGAMDPQGNPSSNPAALLDRIKKGALPSLLLLLPSMISYGLLRWMVDDGEIDLPIALGLLSAVIVAVPVPALLSSNPRTRRWIRFVATLVLVTEGCAVVGLFGEGSISMELIHNWLWPV